MIRDALSEPMQPVKERIAALDAMRGAALLGVLLVNLEVGFRVSLFQEMLMRHTHAGWANHAVDLLIVWVFEFKAFTLFSFLFGVGIGVQVERAVARRHSISHFLGRRFGVLLMIGLGHMLLVWNGDILTLYAVCGFLIIPFVALPTRWLAVLAIAIVMSAPYLPFFGAFFPAQETISAQAVIATRVYATGSFTEIMVLRWQEAWHFILPLLIGSLPRTFGLILAGIAFWRSGVLQQPPQHRTLLKRVFIVTGTIGALTKSLQLWANETDQPAPAALSWIYPYDVVLLASAYGAGMLLWLNCTQSSRVHWLVANGRLALSNYLAQSVIFSVLFYGFGLFGKLGSAVTALLGLTVFAAQLLASAWWLRHYQFGPAEWLWRSLTYGRWQPLKRLVGGFPDPQ